MTRARGMAALAIAAAIATTCFCSCAPPPPVPERPAPGEGLGPPPPGLDERLAELERAAADHGLRWRVLVASEVAVTGVRQAVAGPTPTAACLLFHLDGTAGLADLDLALYDASGLLLGEDRRPARAATLVACALDRAPLVEVHVARGAGRYALVSLEGEEEAVVALAESLGAEGGATPRVLTEVLGPAIARLARRGYGLVGDPWRLRVDASPVALGLAARAGRCYVVLASTGRADVSLRVVVRDGQGEVLAEDEGAPVEVCAPRTEALVVELSAGEGASDAHLAILEAPPP